MPGIITKLLDPNNGTFPSITTCQNGHEWSASFEFYPREVGSRKTVFDGVRFIQGDYGSRSDAVVKAVNSGRGVIPDMLHEVSCAKTAQEFAKLFTQIYPQWRINFLVPCASVIDTVAVYNGLFRYIKNYNKTIVEGECVLIERKLEGDFMNFTLKNGVVTSSCPDVLQAFGHFTYFQSNGTHVVSGLQGVQNGSTWILSAPIVHSTSGEFGKCDGGQTGIDTFFLHHRCSHICKDWPRPSFNNKTGSSHAPKVHTAPSAPISLPPYDTNRNPPPYQIVQE